MDIAGIPAFGAGSPVQRPAPEPPRPAVAPVEPALAGARIADGLTGRGSSGTGTDAGLARRDGAAGRARTAPDKDVLTGPPPAFEASLLDLEADLRRVLARLEAERGRRESQSAIRTEASGLPRTEAPDQTTEPA